MQNIKLNRKKISNKLNRNGLIKLLNFINWKLAIIVLSKPLVHDVNDEPIDKFFTPFASLTKDIGKVLAISVSTMIIYSKMSLHAFGSGSRGYSTIWINFVKDYRSETYNFVIIL